jgi:hypothetical protein
MAPLFSAYPRLIHFGVRGGEGLSLGANRHPSLQTLIVETGGLDREILHEIWRAGYPALEHLELWLGSAEYGWNGRVDDLQPLLTGDLFPRLHTLGLRDSEITDEIARAIAQLPLLHQLEVLDLSLGTLSDEGAGALLASEAVRGLRRLDLHHHFCSDEMVERLNALARHGVEVDASEPQQPEVWDGAAHRFVAVSE